MSPDLADTAARDPTPGALAAPRKSAGSRVASRHRAGGRAASRHRAGERVASRSLRRALAVPLRWQLPRLQAARRAALRDVWRALWLSRLLVWLAGFGAVATLGFGPVRHVFDPPGLTRGFGWLGDALAAPAARWDAAWYLTIAHWGYAPDLGAFSAPRAAFFPLYPLALRATAALGPAPILAGVLVSLLALALALYWLHRLTALEAARLRLPDADGVARLAVLSLALAPMGVFLSAVYSESLFLALSVGTFLMARRGRWAAAAALAALAAATRSAGIVLVLPLALLYLYGPREDRPEDRQPSVCAADEPAGSPPRAEGFAGSARRALERLLPRYRLRRDAAWLALVPTGLGLYVAYYAAGGGDALAPFHAETVWGRRFAGPFLAVWRGLRAGAQGALHPGVAGGHNLELLLFLLAGAVALVGVLRVLPFAHGAYVLGALALPLSYPVASQPLMSLPRFLLVLFPLNIWLAIRLAARPLLARAALAASALAMAFFAASFATWHWVA